MSGSIHSQATPRARAREGGSMMTPQEASMRGLMEAIADAARGSGSLRAHSEDGGVLGVSAQDLVGLPLQGFDEFEQERVIRGSAPEQGVDKGSVEIPLSKVRRFIVKLWQFFAFIRHRIFRVGR